MTAPDVSELADGKYLSLTTFRKDGRAVATPVWVVRHSDSLLGRVLTWRSGRRARKSGVDRTVGIEIDLV